MATTRRKRGRKSAAELSITAPLQIVPRPDPPDADNLADDEIAEWWSVINRLPADHFPRESHALLAAYTRHITSARRLSESIWVIEHHLTAEVASGELSPVEAAYESVAALGKLLRLRDAEVRAASSLATRLRITQQAASRPKSAPPVRVGPVPWVR
jgi:hypothetical protein